MSERFKPSTMLNQLPQHPIPFVGRRQELTTITRLLSDPTCRLLTLVGPGGIGKTRLAVQAAATLPEPFPDGIYFVFLQPVQSTDYLIPAIADALNIHLVGQPDPRLQVFNQLQDKALLLLLDNFEHLVTGAGLLTDLLQTAPTLKILVTSREALNLPEEWLLPVTGLPYPEALPHNTALMAEKAPPEEVEAYSAVQLFAGYAQRLRPDFSLAAEWAGVVHICQLVEGTPLALELAAAWVKTLSCAEIAAEIQRNLDFLTTHRRSEPDRHQSMKAVFNQSYALLDPEEQAIFKRLAVFRGGFRRDAAERVARASLAALTTLVDKSLLQRQPDNHYQIHELLRQYAAEQLVLSPEALQQAYAGHCAYYLNFLTERLESLRGGRQQEATAEIAAELKNIRAAWQWAVELMNIEAIQKSSEALALFNQFQSRYLETATAFQRAVERLREAQPPAQVEPVLAQLLVGLSWACIRLGRLADAEAAATESQTLYHRLALHPPPGYTTDPRLPLGIIALIRGDYAEALRLGQEARRFNEPQGYLWNLQLAYYLLTRATLLQGHPATAHQYAQHAYLTTQTTQDTWFKAYCLNELGNVAGALGDYTAAKGYYQASYLLREAFNDPEGMAVALNHLAEIARQQADYPVARQLYQQSLNTYQKINDRGGLATSLNGLARVAVAQGDYPTAQEQFQQALQIVTDIQFVPLTLSLLIGVGELLLRVGRTERGLELLSLAAAHPAGDYETKADVQRLLTRYKIESLMAQEDCDAGAFTDIVRLVQLELSMPLQADGPIHTPRSNSEDRASQGAAETLSSPSTLIEPLSARELEVLRLIATGRQNNEIAAELVVTLSTIKTHINNIYRKLDVTNRVQALARARDLNLL